jgi:hypothetical protein
MIERILDLPEDERVAMYLGWREHGIRIGRVHTKEQQNSVAESLSIKLPLDGSDPKPIPIRGVSYAEPVGIRGRKRK